MFNHGMRNKYNAYSMINSRHVSVIFIALFYSVSFCQSAETGKGLQFKDDGSDLSIMLNGMSVLSYNYAVDDPPEGVASYYRRSGYIHPLKTPLGTVVTEAFPSDHMHQHAVFFAWVNTAFNGKKVDFWNQHKKLGTVEHVEIANKAITPRYAEFTTRLKHLDLTNPGKPVTALNESWNIRIWNVEGRHQIDIDSVQTCASKVPVKINKYHYGGMGIRGADSWGDPGRHFLTDEGHDRIKGNHTHPKWVAMYGETDGKAASIIAMSHPKNYRFPQAVRLHPKMPYFCFAPCVDGEFTIKPGDEYRSRYRFIVVDGMPDAKKIDAWAEQYQK